jgi:hypothetical protein
LLQTKDYETKINYMTSGLVKPLRFNRFFICTIANKPNPDILIVKLRKAIFSHDNSYLKLKSHMLAMLTRFSV